MTIDLIGTEKQIAYGNDVRSNEIAAIEAKRAVAAALAERSPSQEGRAIAAQVVEYLDRVIGETSAKWWIENGKFWQLPQAHGVVGADKASQVYRALLERIVSMPA